MLVRQNVYRIPSLIEATNPRNGHFRRISSIKVLNLSAVSKFSAVLAIFQICFCFLTASGQQFKPGLTGMAPMRWITIRNTQAPGRVYQSLNSNARTYTAEDTYIKAWIPVVIKSRFALAVGPHYRTERLELQPENDASDQLTTWKLRAIGIDIKSSYALDSTSWLINTANIVQSGNIKNNPQSNIPITYTISSTYIKRKSANKEIGFGLMLNKSNSLLVLPVFVYNYNFSPRQGLEISLPHKIAWRHNLSRTDIIYVKAEASLRTYFIRNAAMDDYEMFRRIDGDLGVAYNKQVTKFMGAELFAGYRQNLSYQLPLDIIAVKNSGFVGTIEIYIRLPQGLNFKKKR